MQRMKMFVGVMFCGALSLAQAVQAFPVKVHEENSDLSPGFIAALQNYAGMTSSFKTAPSTQMWLDAFKKHHLDPQNLAKRLRSHTMKAMKRHGDVRHAFAPFLTLRVEEPVEPITSSKTFSSDPIALHMTKFHVTDEYDDVTNDDIYVYTITTYGDRVWGKVSDIYKGLDEGDTVFFNAQDRGVFGPRGEAMSIQNHLIVDLGIIESDGDDIKQMKVLSDIIVDLAVVALTIENPQAGIAAAKARQEVKNLLHLIISLENDDRLIAESMYFTPDDIAQNLSGKSFYEFTKRYKTETIFTRFDYELMWRFLRP